MLTYAHGTLTADEMRVIVREGTVGPARGPIIAGLTDPQLDTICRKLETQSDTWYGSILALLFGGDGAVILVSCRGRREPLVLGIETDGYAHM